MRQALTPWDETSATFNTRNGVSSWAAGAFSSSDYGTTSLGTIDPSTTGLKTVNTANLLSLVQSWVNGGANNFGLVLIGVPGAPNEDDNVEYATRENGTAANRPRLRVTWTQTASTQPATRVELIANPLLVTGTTPVTVTMNVSASGTVNGVTPPATLSSSGEAGATATYVSGPTPAGPVNLAGSPGSPDSATFTYVYNVSPGSNPGSVTFFGKPSAPPDAFPSSAASNSTIVTPPLTFQVRVDSPVPPGVAQITNVGNLDADEGSSESPPVTNNIDQPALTLTKSNTPAVPDHPRTRRPHHLHAGRRQRRFR